jgi:ABC-type multidrug transport system fused ATPase/permease subunit
MLLLRLLLAQWQKDYARTYKSYIGPDNKVRKKLIMPKGKEIAEMLGGLLRPQYLLALAVLIFLFVLNHLLLFAPFYLQEYFPRLWVASWENILLAFCLVSVLMLAATVLAQTQEIKQNNQAYNIQNLIINAHSQVDLGYLQIDLDDSDKLFLSLNKMEYIMQAKSIPSLRQPQSQTLLQISLFLKVSGDIPITEFYVKRLSLFVADIVIEGENVQQKFYPLFAVNNNYNINFYICCKEVPALKLTKRFFSTNDLRLYFCFILKNSVGVITELYGTALYEREQIPGISLCYMPQEIKGNQYFYI